MLSATYSAKQRKDEGFTLIELLIVVIIIGILAAIALPIFINQQRVAVDASVQSDVRNTVTNIVNAQAQKASSAIAAVSGADTKVALTAVPAGSAAGTAATTVTATKEAKSLTNIPNLGSAYTVDGYNAGGNKFVGTAAKPAFEFTSTTGKFTQGNGAAPGSAPAGGSTGSSSDPGVANDSAYSGTEADFSFNGYQGLAGGGSSLQDGTLNLAAGWFSSEGTVTEGPAFMRGMQGYGTSDSARYYLADNFPSKVYDKSGQLLAEANCNVNAYDYGSGILSSAISPTFDKNGLYARFNCGLLSNINASGAANLVGGRLEFTDQNGEQNVIPITGTVIYVPSIADKPVNTTIASTSKSAISASSFGFANFLFSGDATDATQNMGTDGASTHSSIPFFNNVAPTESKDERFYPQQIKFFDASGTDVTNQLTSSASQPLDNCTTSASNYKSYHAPGYYEATAMLQCAWGGSGMPVSDADFQALLNNGHIELDGVSYGIGTIVDF